MAAPPLPALSITQLIIRWELAGQTILNTFNYYFDSAVEEPNYNVIMRKLIEEFDGEGEALDQWRDQLSDEITLKEVSAQPVYPVRLAPFRKQYELSGTVATPSVPVNCAMVAQKTSFAAARYGVGSTHIAGLPSSALLTAGSWSVAQSGAMENVISLFNVVKNILPDGYIFRPVLWSPLEPTRITEVTGTVVKDQARVMRRRTVGLGI